MSETMQAAPTEAIFALMARLADNKYFLGRSYAEWCSSAPTLESSVAAAAMAQDELGHARAIYPVLKSLAPEAGAETDPETRTAFTALSCLREPFAGWEDFVAANVLIDTALTLIFEAGKDSTFEPLAGRSRKVLQEERMHAQHGEGWVRRMAREGGAAREAQQTALRRVWDEVFCWFGPSSADDPLTAAGILDATPDELRARLLAVVGPILGTIGLDLPMHRVGERWELSEPLPWDRWDAATYQLVPANADNSTGASKRRRKESSS
ncbi:MAG TPA: Phenylacetic acid catabolic protein [Ktedonobacterales bacterium]|nr:Phenylacetic acid catabolic protein [Ktedonobacterales bacterium]